MNAPAPPKNWQRLTDEQLLQYRVRDLHLKIPGSFLEACIGQLYAELEQKGIRFRPPCYLADEWLCPDKEPIIGIPFCLAHPRLKRLEKKMMFEVEGGTKSACMKLLRHECGHSFNYAYKLYTRTRWRKLFGPFSQRYSTRYAYQPYSRRFVIHLDGHYAQSHPDEDFAETFAVWLSPQNNWRTKYIGWGALKKLEYVEHLAQTLGSAEPIVRSESHPPWSARRMRSTLAAYYERKRKSLGTDFRGYYDQCLQDVFTVSAKTDPAIPAAEFLRENRKILVNEVTHWTQHRKYDIMQLVSRLIQRSQSLELYADPQNLIAITALVTAIAGNTLRQQRRNGK